MRRSDDVLARKRDAVRRAFVANDAAAASAVVFAEEEVESALADRAGGDFVVVLPFGNDDAARYSGGHGRALIWGFVVVGLVL